MTIQFENKVAVVTGAGGGLGRAHALELAKRGAKVLVNDYGGSMDGSSERSSAMANAVVEEIRAAGGQAIADAGSVSVSEQAEAMIQAAHKEWGRVDILINNAGILRDKSFAKMADADFLAVIDVHLLGAYYCTKAAWSIMREQNYGRIVMTTSPSGLFGNFGQTNYGAAKMGQVGFMNTLKLEGAKYNIRTNAVAPVATTRMTVDLIPKENQQAVPPELVTSGVVFLCSEDAPNGAILQTVGSKYSMVYIAENKGVRLGDDATADDVAEHFSEIASLDQLKPRA